MQKTVIQWGLWALLLWPQRFAASTPLDCRDDQGNLSRCTSISQEKLLDRVIHHAELIYRVSEELSTLFFVTRESEWPFEMKRHMGCYKEYAAWRLQMSPCRRKKCGSTVSPVEELFIPFPFRLQSNQTAYSCITKALPIPSSKSEVQQISDKWLLHSVLMLIQSWIEPLVYLQMTMERYNHAPDMLLNKTKWVSEKLSSLEQGVMVLIKKMLDENTLGTGYSEQGVDQHDEQPEVLESVMRDYFLLSCFKKDAHKMETFLKLLKCRQTDKYNCA